MHYKIKMITMIILIH